MTHQPPLHDSANPPQSNPVKQKIAEELERLTVASIEAFNDKDFSYTGSPDREEFLTRIAPSFEARIERVNEVLDWQGLSTIWRNLATTLPDVKFEIVNVTVDVFGFGKASVFLETSTEVQEGVKWNRIMEYKWYMVEGVWMHSALTSISGSQGNSGMVV